MNSLMIEILVLLTCNMTRKIEVRGDLLNILTMHLLSLRGDNWSVTLDTVGLNKTRRMTMSKFNLVGRFLTEPIRACHVMLSIRLDRIAKIYQNFQDIYWNLKF